MSSVLKLKESFDNSQEPLIGQKLHLPFENNILHHGNKKYGQREAKSTERPQQQQFIGGFFLKSGTSMLTTKKVGLQE
jgi:hypothetical protein